MSKQQTPAPKLRFAEFQDEWQQKKLEDLSERVSVGLATSVTAYYEGRTETSVPIIRNLNIKKGYFDDSDMLYLNQAFSKKHPNKRVKSGDIITVHTGSNVGLTCVVPEQYNLAQTFTTLIVTLKKHLLIPHYLNFLLNSFKGEYQALRLVVGGGKGNLNTGDLKLYPVKYPTLPEQRKIADFLTAVDGRIQQLIQKRALLEDYKKGVMQALFTQAIRFKDDHGNDFPDWEEKQLGEIASFSKGSGISKAEVHEDGATPCIRYGELYTHYSELIGAVRSRTNVEKKQLVMSQRNDVIIPASGETHIDIATASCVMEEGVALGGDLNIIRAKTNGVFLAYYLNNAMKHAIAGMAQGSSVIHLYPAQLKLLKLSIPSLPEQTMIADFLSAIDRKIESVAAQITETQTFKRGLLQQMFV